jgi:hypothetical protein
MKTLVKDSAGKWCIVAKELTCGNVVKAKCDGLELWGRIEYSDSHGGYYFLSEEHRITKNITDINVWFDETNSFKPLVKNSRGRWQIAEQTLRVGSTLYLYLFDYGWQLCITQYCNKEKIYYFVTTKKILPGNKQWAIYLDENFAEVFEFLDLEVRTVEEQDALIREAEASEQEEGL